MFRKPKAFISSIFRVFQNHALFSCNMSDNDNHRNEEEPVVIDDCAVNQDDSETPSLSDVDVDSLGMHIT